MYIFERKQKMKATIINRLDSWFVTQHGAKKQMYINVVHKVLLN